MVKLEGVGIRGELMEWIQDWLTDRQQQMRVDGNLSEWEEVSSSVVQGSVLGGTLFNIFINDIDEAAINALLRKFADDTKVAMIIQKKEDAERFKQVIDELCEWARKWEMPFNVK